MTHTKSIYSIVALSLLAASLSPKASADPQSMIDYGARALTAFISGGHIPKSSDNYAPYRQTPTKEQLQARLDILPLIDKMSDQGLLTFIEVTDLVNLQGERNSYNPFFGGFLDRISAAKDAAKILALCEEFEVLSDLSDADKIKFSKLLGTIVDDSVMHRGNIDLFGLNDFSNEVFLKLAKRAETIWADSNLQPPYLKIVLDLERAKVRPAEELAERRNFLLVNGYEDHLTGGMNIHSKPGRSAGDLDFIRSLLSVNRATKLRGEPLKQILLVLTAKRNGSNVEMKDLLTVAFFNEIRTNNPESREMSKILSATISDDMSVFTPRGGTRTSMELLSGGRTDLEILELFKDEEFFESHYQLFMTIAQRIYLANISSGEDNIKKLITIAAAYPQNAVLYGDAPVVYLQKILMARAPIDKIATWKRFLNTVGKFEHYDEFEGDEKPSLRVSRFLIERIKKEIEVAGGVQSRFSFIARISPLVADWFAGEKENLRSVRKILREALREMPSSRKTTPQYTTLIRQNGGNITDEIGIGLRSFCDLLLL